MIVSTIRRTTQRTGMFAVLFIVLATAACREATFEAAGTVQSAPEEMPDLGGLGVWIRHDGLQYGGEGGKRVAIDGMRTPFRVGRRVDRAALDAGQRVAFRFKPLQRGGFPFEVTEVKPLN